MLIIAVGVFVVTMVAGILFNTLYNFHRAKKSRKEHEERMLRAINMCERVKGRNSSRSRCGEESSSSSSNSSNSSSRNEETV